MAKLGDNEFPEIGLVESVELARRIYDELDGEIRRDSLAIVLGMSPVGGAFGARVGALRMWGLATGASGDGMIRLTNDGIKIANPTNPLDERDLMRRLAASVPLFNGLHELIGDASVDQNVLAVKIQEVTGVEMPDVMRRVAIVERIFGSIRGHLSDSSNDDMLATIHAQARAAADKIEALPKGWIEFRYDDGALRMRETAPNLGILIDTLESRRDSLLSNR